MVSTLKLSIAGSSLVRLVFVCNTWGMMNSTARVNISSYILNVPVVLDPLGLDWEPNIDPATTTKMSSPPARRFESPQTLEDREQEQVPADNLLWSLRIKVGNPTKTDITSNLGVSIIPHFGVCVECEVVCWQLLHYPTNTQSQINVHKCIAISKNDSTSWN